MQSSSQSGLTLVEVLLAIAVMAMLAVGTTSFVNVCLQAGTRGTQRADALRSALLTMERMTGKIRQATFVMIPNSHRAGGTVLALSGFHNADGDHYFDDTLFPRYDEDPINDMTADGAPGIAGIDDDGSGAADDGAGADDDDEDGLVDEDPLNGVDDDADGNIDEDCGRDANQDGASGFAGIDDDLDGGVDEAIAGNDDEDGSANEAGLTALVFSLEGGTGRLRELVPADGSDIVLLENVIAFDASYEAPDNLHDPRIRITLTLAGSDGRSLTLSEYAYPRNSLQKTGKRVH